MEEVAAGKNFGWFGYGLTPASELAEMTPEPNAFALQSPCLLD
jgi:hypothetical protein